jgi:hypothetical protein
VPSETKVADRQPLRLLLNVVQNRLERQDVARSRQVDGSRDQFVPVLEKELGFNVSHFCM